MNQDLLRVFETESDYDLAKPYFVYPTVSYVRDVDDVRYMDKPIPNYLYIEALADNCEVGFGGNNEVLCSTDGNEWSVLSEQTEKVVINHGEKLYIKGECEVGYNVYFGFGVGSFIISQQCNVGGNIMSLLFNDNFENVDLTNVDFGFSNLFAQQPIVNASQLILPSVVCGDMGCYYGMFSDCTSLTTAPALPATTLTRRCYDFMFQGCTALFIAPELPATILADRCYSSMFLGCSNLSYIKMLATDISAENCLYSWVNGVSSTGTFVKDDALSVETIGIGVNGVPEGWTVVGDSVSYLPEYDTNGVTTNFVIGQSYPDVVPVFQSIMNRYNDMRNINIIVNEQVLLIGNGTAPFVYPLGDESLFTDYLSRLTYVDASTGTTPIVLIVIDVANNEVLFGNSLEGQPNIYIDLTDGLCQEYLVG